MIELCSPKRMLLSIILLVGLTILILIIESRWTTRSVKFTTSPTYRGNITNENCWLREEFEVLDDCKPCTDVEILNNHKCNKTGFIQPIKCKNFGNAVISCNEFNEVDEAQFWIFEVYMIIFGILSACTGLNNNMTKLYVSIAKVKDGVISCEIETVIILFVYKFVECNFPIIFVHNNENRANILFDINGFDNIDGDKEKSVQSDCLLPFIWISNKNYYIAGISAICRYLSTNSSNRNDLLGYRNRCLSDCAETSNWTKICEIELPKMVKEAITERKHDMKILCKLEKKLKEPSESKNNNYSSPECYMEGNSMLLSDIVVVPCIHILFKLFFTNKLELLNNWYENMYSILEEILELIRLEKEGEIEKEEICNDLEEGKITLRRYTNQGDIERGLNVIDSLNIDNLNLRDEYYKLEFNWSEELKPQGLPEKRLLKKMQQLENMVYPILKIAKEGDKIVEFCCGAGHLGILVAYLLPICKVILVDNKENSLRRALDQIGKLSLSNVTIIQSNIDYYKGTYQIGISLHACGVATDIVINNCIRNKASFVVSPCCYGKLQDNHILSYPRSAIFEKYLSWDEYMVLGHSADQTHSILYEKSEQGERCMDAIDTDRCLQALEMGYDAYFSKMVPSTCSPKNHYIVGVLK